MERIHMTDVIPLIGLPYPPSGRASYYVSCPCCDTKPNKRHLNINLQRDVFRCPRCGVSGGIFDLYSLYTNTPRDKARREILDRLGGADKFALPKVSVVSPTECPLTDVETRHATYCALLSKLSLASDHRENLIGRGLTDEEISSLGYKTTPAVGSAVIARQLRGEGYYLAGVPGFYRSEDIWTFICERRGILIPVRDIYGRIQGLQIRRDNAQKRKFRWVSSAEKLDGCRAEGWVHFAGIPNKRVILTEGPMKADVIHALTGLSVLAVPGVNSLSQLKLALEELRQQGLEEIKTAFDMDLLCNKHVQDGYRRLQELLDGMGFRYGTYLWDPTYKGLDDYIWECCLNRRRQK